MSLASDVEIASVDWAAYNLHNGPALHLGGIISALLSSVDADAAAEAWEGIEEQVFSQGTIYSAAEPTVSVMLAALTEEQPSWRSGRIMDLLLFIVTGESEEDPTLHDRCQTRAREGLWLLVARAMAAEGWARKNAVEIVGAIAPDRFDLIQALTTAS